jgi:hypothetical protein
MKRYLKEWKNFVIKESGFNRIKNILQGDVAPIATVGFMTGWNPMAKQLPSKENRLLNKELVAWLRERGYGPIRIRGKFGNRERSMIIPNITRGDMVEAGKYFNQVSIIWGEKEPSKNDNRFVFQYIEGDKTIQRRDVVLFGKDVQGREDFYSQERQSAGRKFYIPFFDDQYEMDEGEKYTYDIPPLTEEQRSEHSSLLEEIDSRVHRSLDDTRTQKSRWHHRQILRLRMKELKSKL